MKLCWLGGNGTRVYHAKQKNLYSDTQVLLALSYVKNVDLKVKRKTDKPLWGRVPTREEGSREVMEGGHMFEIHNICS